MPENRQVHSVAVSNPSSDIVQDTTWRLEACDILGGDVGGSVPYPTRQGEPNCVYYLRTGLCSYGNNCRYNHPSNPSLGLTSLTELPQRPGQPDCRYFLKTGTCKYGRACKYHHPSDRNGAEPIYLNSVGLPLRQDEKSCPYYMRTGLCKFGAACKFHHPQLSLSKTVSPLAGGSMGSSIPSSSALPYSGGYTSWCLPRPPYLSATRMQGQQQYTPVLYSPPGIVPPHDWVPYMGNSGAMSSIGILGPNFVYNSSRHYEATGGAYSSFPERRDQRECKYFMSTGSCKYGSNCKFNHPPKMPLPIRLPSIPGQPMCSGYYMYGKYSPGCEFGPLGGYSYNYPLAGIPSMPMIPYPGTSPSPEAASQTSNSSKVFEWIQKPDQPAVGAAAEEVKEDEEKEGQSESPVDLSPCSEILPKESED